MQQVEWNSQLEIDLNQYIIKNGGEILFTDDPNFSLPVDQKHNWRMFHLMEYPEFAKYNATCNYLTHDTNRNGKFKVFKLFIFRLQQSDCFDYKNCNTSQYTGFASCINPALEKNNSKECAYSNQFYMRLLIPEIESIACASTGVPGPYTPSHQPNSFVCYYCAAKKLLFSNDIIYSTGPRASQCPENYIPSNGLCLKKKSLRLRLM
jgi:hypothetical protein